MVRIVHNKLLGAWFVVRGPHQSPLGGPHASKADAQAWLDRRNSPMSFAEARRRARLEVIRHS